LRGNAMGAVGEGRGGARHERWRMIGRPRRRERGGRKRAGERNPQMCGAVERPWRDHEAGDDEEEGDA